MGLKVEIKLNSKLFRLSNCNVGLMEKLWNKLYLNPLKKCTLKLIRKLNFAMHRIKKDLSIAFGTT